MLQQLRDEIALIRDRDPAARSSVPMARPTLRVSAGSSMAPSAIWEGNQVKSRAKRMTRPPSCGVGARRKR